MLSSRGLCGTSTVKSREKCYRTPLYISSAPILRLASMKALKESTLSAGPGGNNNNNAAQLPEYIVDPSTKTTYLKGKFLGKGGFARVHELTDLTTNKVYAGKIIPKSRITKPYHKEKIVREIELHRTLKHEHVVGFHHFFEDEENVYIILENCSRKSLVHILKYRRTLTEPEVRFYLHQLVSGVQYVHSQHVIHRDLKLGNMFLTEDLVMKIGDFGLATRLEQGGQKKITICGTPNYIAPEVLNKQGHSYSADIWAVGCIMYAMLVGQPPFETTTLKETYARITSNKYSIPPLISSSARSLMIALLQAEPVDRPCLDAILVHEFFTNGYMPLSLPVSSCTVPPKFSATNLITRSATVSPEPLHQNSLTHELRKLTRTVSQLCLSGSKSENKVVALKEKASKVRNAKKDASLQNTLRQKISNVLCSEKSSSKKLKPLTATALYQILSTCLDAMPEEPASCPTVSPIVPIVFVSKWIDYSNKYGFGFRLSDRSIGVLFNDNTKMSYTADGGRVEFHDADGRVTMHSTTSVPVGLQDHNTLLRYFSKYMDENLTEGGCLKQPDASKRSGPVPHMQRWVRTTKAIVMQLSTGTIQVNFFKDHTKVVVSEEDQECYVTYIDENRQSSTYRLLQLLQGGCPAILHQRLLYVVGMLRDFSQLESTEV